MGRIFRKVCGVSVIGIFFCLSPLNGYEDLRLETWGNNLNNEKVLIRKSAAKYLGLLGDRRAIPYLLKTLKDDEAEVRAEICNALGLLGDDSVNEYLQNVLYRDSSPMVRNAAKRALDNVKTYITLQKEKKLKELKEKLKTQMPQ